MDSVVGPRTNWAEESGESVLHELDHAVYQQHGGAHQGADALQPQRDTDRVSQTDSVRGELPALHAVERRHAHHILPPPQGIIGYFKPESHFTTVRARVLSIQL